MQCKKDGCYSSATIAVRAGTRLQQSGDANKGVAESSNAVEAAAAAKTKKGV
ncbi:hypothetical protein HN511_04405 [bacterium]|nr:hypothetical protein [bacterium]